MSLRCSLLGHSYGDAEIEREREEQGSEVVVTVREFEECQRCGERKVVTENKEVTAIEAPDPDADAGAESDDPSAESVDGSPAGDYDADSSPAVENDFEGAQSADEDDAVILDDDDDSAGGGGDGDRNPGEWPDADSTHPAEVEGDRGPGEWPDVGREDEGFDAEPGESGDAEVDFGGGLRPESAPDVDENEADEVEFVNAEGDTLDANRGDARGGGASLSTGFTSSGSVPAPDGPAEDPELDAEFVCPECGHREAVAGSSMRAGDICPECRKGYIAQE